MRSIADLSFRNRRIIKEDIYMGKEKGVKPVPGSEAYGQPELPSDMQSVSAGGRTDDDLRFLLQSDDNDPDPWDYDDYGDRDSDDGDDYLDDDDDFEDESEDLLDIVERRSWSKPEMNRTLSEEEEEDEESEALVPVVSGLPALTQKTAAPVIAPPPPAVPAAKDSQSIAKPAKITAADSIRKKAVKTAKAVKTKPSTLKVAKVSARKASKKVATKKAAVKKAAPKAPAKKAVKAPAKKAAKPAKKAVKKVARKPVKKAAKKPVKKAAKK